MKISPKERGELLKAGRVKNGLSCNDVARKLNVHRATVLRWEQGYIDRMNYVTLKALSALYSIPFESLVDNSRTNTLDIEKQGYTVSVDISDEECKIIKLFRVADADLKSEVKQYLEDGAKNNEKQSNNRG